MQSVYVRAVALATGFVLAFAFAAQVQGCDDLSEYSRAPQRLNFVAIVATRLNEPDHHSMI
jgi:hypothetical protein